MHEGGFLPLAPADSATDIADGTARLDKEATSAVRLCSRLFRAACSG